MTACWSFPYFLILTCIFKYLNQRWSYSFVIIFSLSYHTRWISILCSRALCFDICKFIFISTKIFHSAFWQLFVAVMLLKYHLSHKHWSILVTELSNCLNTIKVYIVLKFPIKFKFQLNQAIVYEVTKFFDLYHSQLFTLRTWKTL